MFEVVTMDIIVFWDVTPYNVFYSEDCTRTFLQSFGEDRLYMASDTLQVQYRFVICPSHSHSILLTMNKFC